MSKSVILGRLGTILGILTCFIALSLSKPAVAQNFDTDTQLCSAITNNGIVNISTKSGDRDVEYGDYNCLFTPEAMRINLYEIRLCETYPVATDYTEKCNVLVSNAAGKMVSISNDLSTSITDQEISIAEGTYKFATVLVAPTIESRFSITFDSPMQGANAGTGTTCWSNGKEGLPTYLDGHDEMTVSCGLSTEAAPVFSPVYFYAMWDDRTNNFTNSVSGLAETSLIYVDAYLMNDATTPMPMSGLEWLNGDQSSGVVVGNSATRLLGVSQITPITISPETTNVDIGFSIENTYYAKTSTNQKYRADGTFDGTASGGGGAICSMGSTEACFLNAAPERFIFRATSN